MKTLLAVVLTVTILAAPAAAGDAEFHAIVRAVESGYGVHQVHIPLFGLARFVVKVAQPEGVHDFDMAIFETPEGPPADLGRFDSIVRHAGGGHWSPMVRVRSRGCHEWVYIYVRPEGRDWRMLIATFGASQTVVLEAKVDPEILARALDDPEHAGDSLNGPGDQASRNEP